MEQQEEFVSLEIAEQLSDALSGLIIEPGGKMNTLARNKAIKALKNAKGIK